MTPPNPFVTARSIVTPGTQMGAFAFKPQGPATIFQLPYLPASPVTTMHPAAMYTETGTVVLGGTGNSAVMSPSQQLMFAAGSTQFSGPAADDDQGVFSAGFTQQPARPSVTEELSPGAGDIELQVGNGLIGLERMEAGAGDDAQNAYAFRMTDAQSETIGGATFSVSGGRGRVDVVLMNDRADVWDLTVALANHFGVGVDDVHVSVAVASDASGASGVFVIPAEAATQMSLGGGVSRTGAPIVMPMSMAANGNRGGNTGDVIPLPVIRRREPFIHADIQRVLLEEFGQPGINAFKGSRLHQRLRRAFEMYDDEGEFDQFKRVEVRHAAAQGDGRVTIEVEVITGKDQRAVAGVFTIRQTSVRLGTGSGAKHGVVYQVEFDRPSSDD